MSGEQPGGVDLYVGGTEHAVLHLLYARFWHKVLFDLGHLSKPEPFQRLVNQGMILGEDGRKMSKRWGNVIDPLDVVAAYGADAFRCYEMFMGPLEQMKPWSMKGVEGVSRFLARVWRLIMEENQAGEWILSSAVQEVAPEKAVLKVLHATIKKVTEDIETLSFNTAISQMMILVNALTNAPVKPVSALRPLLVILNPFAPHLTSELWAVLQQKFGSPAGDITAQTWPDLRRTAADRGRSGSDHPGKRQAARQDRRALGLNRGTVAVRSPGQREDSGTPRGQDHPQGGRRPQEACEHRRDLTRLAVHVERIQRVCSQRECHRPGSRCRYRCGLRRNRHVAGQGYHHATDRICSRAVSIFRTCFSCSKPSGATYATLADATKAGAITWNYGNFITLGIQFPHRRVCDFHGGQRRSIR